MKRRAFHIELALLGIAAAVAFYFNQALIGSVLLAAIVVRTWAFDQRERERTRL